MTPAAPFDVPIASGTPGAVIGPGIGGWKPPAEDDRPEGDRDERHPDRGGRDALREDGVGESVSILA
ncbi:hypothetical protein ACFQL4_17225 [Halosimplex aquaticum]